MNCADMSCVEIVPALGCLPVVNVLVSLVQRKSQGISYSKQSWDQQSVNAKRLLNMFEYNQQRLSKAGVLKPVLEMEENYLTLKA